MARIGEIQREVTFEPIGLPDHKNPEGDPLPEEAPQAEPQPESAPAEAEPLDPKKEPVKTG